MSLDAIALFPFTVDHLTAFLRVEHVDQSEHGEVTSFRVVGRTLKASPLAGGCKVALDMRYDTPPETLGTLIRRDFGDALGALDRVFIYPSVARPDGTDYDEVLRELGEGGEWLSIPSADKGVGGADASSMLQGLAAGLGPDLMGQMQKMMSDPGAMSQLAELAQGLMADGQMRGLVENAARTMQTGGGDLMQSAKEIAETAGRNQPALLEQLSAQFGIAPAVGADSEEE